MLSKLILTPVCLLPPCPSSEFVVKLCLSLSVYACAVMDSHRQRKLGRPKGWMVCRGRLLVMGSLRLEAVWCSYLLCADENRSFA